MQNRAIYAGLLEALLHVVGSAKGYLRNHGPRVGLLSRQIGMAMGLSERETSHLLFAGVLADIGMVGLAEEAWENPVPQLPPAVRDAVREHPIRSEARMRGIPHLEALAPVVRHHHEWWNGGGYPDGLARSEIPVGARILRLADTVVALESWRPQRDALSTDQVLEIVKQSAGEEFCPYTTSIYLDLHHGEGVAQLDERSFWQLVERAQDALLPDRVSTVSGHQLMSLLSLIVDAKDPYTAGHSYRVAKLCAAMGRELGMDEEDQETLWAGGYLHDLGKVQVPLRILTAQRRLSDDEFDAVKRHPGDGAAMLSQIPALRHLTPGVRYHHEKWDGTGYPEGLKGGQIPWSAQIMTLCDCYDAMTSHRAYRRRRTHQQAIDEVARCAGTHFNPDLADTFAALRGEVFDDVRAFGPAQAYTTSVEGLERPGALASVH